MEIWSRILWREETPILTPQAATTEIDTEGKVPHACSFPRCPLSFFVFRFLFPAKALQHRGFWWFQEHLWALASWEAGGGSFISRISLGLNAQDWSTKHHLPQQGAQWDLSLNVHPHPCHPLLILQLRVSPGLTQETRELHGHWLSQGKTNVF